MMLTHIRAFIQRDKDYLEVLHLGVKIRKLL